MTASDRRARGGGVIDTLSEANGSVLAVYGGGGRGTWRCFRGVAVGLVRVW